VSRSLNEFYKRGRVVPEFGDPNIRELFVREYRLIYSIEENHIVLLGLVHGKRDLKTLWRKEKRIAKHGSFLLHLFAPAFYIKSASICVHLRFRKAQACYFE